MRIAFLGTPDFAVPSLRALVGAGHEIAGVFTQPDRPRDRGQKTQPTPTKAAALELGLPTFAFERIRRAEGVAALAGLQPDLMVTAAFGQILPQRILDIPKLGCVNVHGSLLPRYRGPAPIQWAVINGEAETGITTMATDAGVDTGDMLLQRATAIGPDETAGELFDRLASLGAETLLETLRLMEAGKLARTPQNHELATHFPMLTRETGSIDWSKSAAAIHNLVRGVNPWPGAWTMCDGQVMKIWRTRPQEGSGQPGRILRADAKGGLLVGCGEGALEVLELQMPGGRRMAATDYLRGRRLPEGTVLHAG